MAITKPAFVYTWGDGKEGLLGHGDTRSQDVPRRIESLREVEVTSVVCGGLHTLALTKQGHIYAWGTFNSLSEVKKF